MSAPTKAYENVEDSERSCFKVT